VSAIEYYPDGITVKRVEYFGAQPVTTTTPVVISPLGPIGNDLRKPVTS